MRLDHLTKLMDALSEQTWFNLETARRLEMRMGEVTITEVNLLAMARLLDRTGLDVELVATRKDEKKTGTDFEIWLRLRSGRVFGFAVQAKVIYVHDGKYEYRALGHTNANGVQMKLLEDHAARVGAHPVHLFYNGWDTSDSQAPPTPPGRPSGVYGCAAAMTPVVRQVRGKIGNRKGVNRAAPYLARSVPWSDLFRIPDGSGGSAAGGDGGSGKDGPSTNGPAASSGTQPSRDGTGLTRPINMTDHDLTELEARIGRLRGDDVPPRQALELPDYVKRFRGIPREEIRDDEKNSDAPPFALLIEE